MSSYALFAEMICFSFSSAARDRGIRHEVVAMPAESLKHLLASDREVLAGRVQHREYDVDAVILREGEERNALFFIRSGSVRIEREHMEFRFEISRLGAGDIFGEMAFVEGFVASANVVANEPVELDIVAATDVDEIASSDAGFSGRFYKSLAEILSQRLRETTARSAADFSWGREYARRT
jgi:CRP-like cAMP-binding protein